MDSVPAMGTERGHWRWAAPTDCDLVLAGVHGGVGCPQPGLVHHTAQDQVPRDADVVNLPRASPLPRLKHRPAWEGRRSR